MSLEEGVGVWIEVCRVTHVTVISKISFTVVYLLHMMKSVGGCQAAVSESCEKVLQLTKEINLCPLKMP